MSEVYNVIHKLQTVCYDAYVTSVYCFLVVRVKCDTIKRQWLCIIMYDTILIYIITS